MNHLLPVIAAVLTPELLAIRVTAVLTIAVGAIRGCSGGAVTANVRKPQVKHSVYFIQ